MATMADSLENKGDTTSERFLTCSYVGGGCWKQSLSRLPVCGGGGEVWGWGVGGHGRLSRVSKFKHVPVMESAA